jgi:hypothetical protein
VIDDGETLVTIADGSQDFIVANNFPKHTGDPIGTIGNHLAKMKPGGILFYAVPDKRYTFDFRREATALKHLIRDHEEESRGLPLRALRRMGPAGHRDRCRAVEPDWPERAVEIARALEAEDYSIHTHVFTEASFLGLLLHCHEAAGEGFEIE